MALGAMDLLKYGAGSQQLAAPGEMQQNMVGGQNRLGGNAYSGLESMGLNTKAPESSFWMGSKAGTQFYPTMNIQQQGLQNVSIDKILSLLSGGLGFGQQDFSGFEPIEERARNQFMTRTVPGLAERFTNMGSDSRSGSFLPALSSAGSDLEGQLASLRSEYGLGQQKLQHSLLGDLLGIAQKSPWESIYHKRQPGFVEEGGKMALEALLKFLGKKFL